MESKDEIKFMQTDEFQKLDIQTQIRKRPDTYIGSREPCEQDLYVLNEQGIKWLSPYSSEMEIENTNEIKMVKQTISYIPGLLKIFDEPLVNIPDHKRRNTGMTRVKIDIDQATGIIEMSNNGTSIPCEIHPIEKIYVPEMVFFHPLTGSNYNDEIERLGGGRNGFGSKLTFIFSKWVKILIKDHTRRIKYSQMVENTKLKDGSVKTTIHEPKIRAIKIAKSLDSTEIANKDLVQITFLPDYEFFNLTCMDEVHYKVFLTRALEVAGTFLSSEKDVLVYVNSKCVSTQLCRNFKQYVDLYTIECVYEAVNSRWEIAVSVASESGVQTSFVNSIHTYAGGSHVKYIEDQLLNGIRDEIIPKVFSKAEVASFDGSKIPKRIRAFLKDEIHLFVNCLIVNPTFDTQSKEKLTIKKEKFKSDCVIEEKFINKVISKLDLQTKLENWKLKKDGSVLSTMMNDTKSLVNKKKRSVDVPKLQDANDAGTKDSMHCTLIIVEGDSAMSSVKSGLSVLGRDRWGIFPIRGKLLNCLDSSSQQIANNVELKDLFIALGAYPGMKDRTKLRYGHVMLMRDMDHDGTHIQMLLIGDFFALVPDLVKQDEFFSTFDTPLLIISKGKEEKYFMTMGEFHLFESQNSIKGWKIKYIKGLGTLETRHVLYLFSRVADYRYYFTYSGAKCDEAINFAMGKATKKLSDSRKEFLKLNKNKILQIINGELDRSAYRINNHLKFCDFVYNEYLEHVVKSNRRSIPALLDGFKTSQRKVMYVAIMRKLYEEIKVAQLAASVAENSCYGHGETSLCGTVVGMAQNIIGKNNLSLLKDCGQFGKREHGGKDAAKERYIFTYLKAVARKIFHPDDDELLEYLCEEGQSIEPLHFQPIIPMVLVNGSSGIGTFYSSTIPNYNVHELVECIKILLNLKQDSTDEEKLDAIPELHPYYKYFKGQIFQMEPQKYKTFGVLREIDNETLQITELPIDVWTSDYKENFLHAKLLHPKKIIDVKTNQIENLPPLIEDMKEYHTEFDLNFIIKISKEQRLHLTDPEIYPAGLYQAFKLTSDLCTSNMVLFNAKHEIEKFESPKHIIVAFFNERIKLYYKRKDFILNKLEKQMQFISQKVLFKNLVISNQLITFNKAEEKIVDEMKKFNIPDVENNEYSNLLAMPLKSFTIKGIEKLEAELNEKTILYNIIKEKTIKIIYEEDLRDFLELFEEEQKQHVVTEMKEGKKIEISDINLFATKTKSKKNKKSSEEIEIAEEDEEESSKRLKIDLSESEEI